jgi:hypothetical protein
VRCYFFPSFSSFFHPFTVIDLTNPFTLDHLKSTSGGEMLQNISGPTVKVKEEIF